MKIARTYKDDGQVCHLDLWKCYPDSYGCPDRFDRPGAVIRIGPLIEEPLELVVADGYGGRVEVNHGDSAVGMQMWNDDAPVGGVIFTPALAKRLARALDHQSEAAQEAVLI